MFASVKLLWNFMAIYRQKPITVIPQNFYCNCLRTLYHGNSVCPYRIWLVMTASVYVKNCGNLDPRIKLHAIPRFTAGIIWGPHWDHLRFGIICGLGIICGRGSFAALYRTKLLQLSWSSDTRTRLSPEMQNSITSHDFNGYISDVSLFKSSFYIGLTEGTFKQRCTQRKSTFTHRKLSNSTELSKYIWGRFLKGGINSTRDKSAILGITKPGIKMGSRKHYLSLQ